MGMNACSALIAMLVAASVPADAALLCRAEPIDKEDVFTASERLQPVDRLKAGTVRLDDEVGGILAKRGAACHHSILSLTRRGELALALLETERYLDAAQGLEDRARRTIDTRDAAARAAGALGGGESSEADETHEDLVRALKAREALDGRARRIRALLVSETATEGLRFGVDYAVAR